MAAGELIRRVLWLANRDPVKGPISYYNGAIVYSSHLKRSVPDHPARTHLPLIGDWEECALFRSSEDAPYFAYPEGEEGAGIVSFPGVTSAVNIQWWSEEETDDHHWYATFFPVPGLYCRIYPGGNEYFDDWPQRPARARLWKENETCSAAGLCWIRWTITRDNRIIGAAYPDDTDTPGKQASRAHVVDGRIHVSAPDGARVTATKDASGYTIRVELT